MSECQVLIAGAGPTGLVLALWLARRGVRCRIVDKVAGPGQGSRAIAVHARTLEFYRQLGIADDVIAGGIRATRMTMRVHGRPAADVRLGDFGRGLSPYPFILSFPQDDHERLLLDHLARAGVQVERQTELVAFGQDANAVRATLQTAAGEEVVEADYLVGCDGAHSTVRHGLDTGFPGGTYSQVFFVADVPALEFTPEAAINICMSAGDFCLVIPVRSSGTFRLIGIVPPELESQVLTFELLAPAVAQTIGTPLPKANWFSTYHVHHRVSRGFRSGRVFLAGDAAHIHSPAGGQGMNTGIGDAVNLAWKLADVVQGRAAPALLDSYEPERMPFARALVRSTDKLFQFLTSRTATGVFWRMTVMPRITGRLLRVPIFARAAFRRVSQISIGYRGSLLSHGAAGRVHAGDRLPWLQDVQGDNYAPLASLEWQLHVYGEPATPIIEAAKSIRVPLHAFAWTAAAANAGFERGALYVVRPDGHVAVALPARKVSSYVWQGGLIPSG